MGMVGEGDSGTGKEQKVGNKSPEGMGRFLME